MKKIALHSVPRSGSSWLGAILDSHSNIAYRFQPLFSYAFKSYLTESSSKEDIDCFFKKIYESDDAFINRLEDKERGIIPNFKKQTTEAIVYKEVRYHNILENLLNASPDLKVIGLVRNPLATINSWLKAPKEFREDLAWSIHEEWEYAPKKNRNSPEEYNGYRKWKEVTLLFEELEKTHPNNFSLIKYDDLLSNPIETIQTLFKWLQLEWCEQTEEFINTSSSINQQDRYSVYKTKKHDEAWKQELPESIAASIITDIKKSNLERYL